MTAYRDCPVCGGLETVKIWIEGCYEHDTNAGPFYGVECEKGCILSGEQADEIETSVVKGNMDWWC